MIDRSRPTARSAAEAAFKKATTPKVEGPAPAPAVPGAKEMVTLRVEREVLEYFQAGGPGWQERMNAVLKAAAGK